MKEDGATIKKNVLASVLLIVALSRGAGGPNLLIVAFY